MTKAFIYSHTVQTLHIVTAKGGVIHYPIHKNLMTKLVLRVSL